MTLAATRGMAVITGGPGTGKTTIIKCILSLMPGGTKVALCAPTGRAARRMTEAHRHGGPARYTACWNTAARTNRTSAATANIHWTSTR